MAGINLKNVTKSFGKTKALEDVCLEIHDDEFFVIFGPAGAGKTTILNIIAGICEPDIGELYFGEEKMNFVESAKRNISMVFENYALYPNMSAYDNIASPLRSKRFKKSEGEIKQKVEKVSKTLNIYELLDRLPSQVSNGQKQRIALGRALVREPNAFLLDEPLAHLDAKLRHAMRKELKAMQGGFKTTTIYVTHDYTEAMSLGDRIAVISGGKVVQVGTADEIFYEPANVFVAKLFGDCEINALAASVYDEGGRLMAKPTCAKLVYEIPNAVASSIQSKEANIIIGMRTAAIEHSPQPAPGYEKALVYTLEPLGNKMMLVAKLGEELIRFIVKLDKKYSINSDVYIKFNMEKALFFDGGTSELISSRNISAQMGGEANG